MSEHSLRIIFMGTPDFAVPSLKKLCDNGYTPIAVYTQPDRINGREENYPSAGKGSGYGKEYPCISAGNT